MKGLQEEWKRKEQSNFGNVVKVENYVILSLLGDGDCSSYNTLCAMNDGNGIYGEGIPVRKEKCVNHFHKRMGTAIRKLVDESTVEHTTKKGKKINKRLFTGKGKFTKGVIEKLQDYYGRAVRRNQGKTVKEMADDIWSTYYHVISSDAVPFHHKCPFTEETWCFYDRALFA